MKRLNQVIPMLGAAALMSCGAEANDSQRPNVIFILVDDLGKEWISSYGSEEMFVPNVERLAEQGIRFDNAYSMPQSTPSRVAITTGQYPFNSGWINHYDVPRWGHGASFDADLNPCLSLKVKAEGYKTCAVGKWQLNDFRLQPNIMNELGYDEYCMWTGGEGANEEISESRYWDPYIHTKEGSKVYKGEFGPDIYNDFVLDFISANKNEPMFIYYPMALTHTPFVTTPHNLEAKTKREKHMAMVEYMDYLVGKVIDRVEAEGLSDNTYIFFTTDNGTAQNVMGRREGRYIAGGKTTLSENGINAPFIVQTPSKPNMKSTDALVDFTDIYPTVMELIGAEDKIDERVDGVSFAKLLEGKSFEPRDWAISLGSHPATFDENNHIKSVYEFRDRAIIGKEYKIYLSKSREIERIYSIESDPYEEANLVGDADIFTKVLAQFKGVINSLPAVDASPKYNKLEGSIYDIPIEEAREKADKNRRSSNFSGVKSEEAYLKFKNGK